MLPQSDASRLEHCSLCPRKCGADRLHGKKGYCLSAGLDVKVARAALHMWEEPCISGDRGSGTVFLTGCNLGCIYCQNREISRNGDAGKSVSIDRLAEIFIELQEQGAHNINLVTPTHYAVQIKASVTSARKKGLIIPVVYNCGGYELAETIAYLGDCIDIYLTDFKYWNNETAEALSNVKDYRERATEALDEMVRLAGTPVFDDDGIMQRGVIVRHLVLPGHEDESKEILRHLYGRYGDKIYISIMNQYTPPKKCVFLPEELTKPVDGGIYDKLTEYAADLGITQGFYQEGGTVSESFVPAFDGFGVLKTGDTVV